DTEHTSLVAVVGTGLALVMVIGVEVRPRSAAGSLLASAPMRWLGERSYSIYLWNDLMRIGVLSTFGYTLIGDIVWIVIFVGLGEASFRFGERRLRAKLARRPVREDAEAGQHDRDDGHEIGAGRDGTPVEVVEVEQGGDGQDGEPHRHRGQER